MLTFAIGRMLFSTAVEGATERLRWWRDKGVWVGLISVALLMTNQSLAWERYIEQDGKGSILKALDPSVWWHHKNYVAAGPYTDDRISIFQTLNPYLAQTHLIVAVAIALFLVYVVLWQLREGEGLSKRLLFGVGLTFGAAFWINGVVWLAAAVFFATLFALYALGACRAAARAAEAGQRLRAARKAAITWIRSACRSPRRR